MPIPHPMCGIVGFAEPRGSAAMEGAEARLAPALRRLVHRGPDGTGTLVQRNVAFGHTRLAIRHPLDHPGADAAAQPIVTPCGRYALVYNGELYDDERWRTELRREVEARTDGRGFVTHCDAETLLWALALRGPSVLDRVRGMYALAFADLERGRLVLARDPLGVKPLFVARSAAGGVAFSSEIAALRAVDGIVADGVDEEMLAAYLATSRRTVFGRTLFEGVRALRPGDVVSYDLGRSGSLEPVVLATFPRFDESVAAPGEAEALSAATGDVLRDSVQRHLISDVPVCAFLSGGLDSAAIVATAAAGRDLATWCSAGVEDGERLGEDPAAAERVAQTFGTRHTFVPVDRPTFEAEWRAHVAHLEQPLSTPNEVAIAVTSRAIRASGARVALSGEGADELFGGYGDVLAALLAHGDELTAARFHLDVSSWFPAASLETFLGDRAHAAVEFVLHAYRAEYARVRASAGPHGTPLEAHLGLQRAVNLASLLERLDAATMRASIEGRTPFADVVVARHAARLAPGSKFEAGADGQHRTKIALRTAFRNELPADIVERPKASFPLPFERWCVSAVPDITRSEFLRAHLDHTTLDALSAGGLGAQSWRAWWLLGNLATFGEVAFGASSGRADAA